MSLLDWTRSETTSPPDRITIKWKTEASGSTPSVEREQVLLSTTKSSSTSSYKTIAYKDATGNIKTQDVQINKKDVKFCTKASVNQEWISARLKLDVGLPSGGDEESSVTDYYYTTSADGPVLEREITETFISLVALAGQLQGIPYFWPNPAQPKQNLYYDPAGGEIISQRTIIEYEQVRTKEGRDVTRTKTSRWVALGLTSEGKGSFERWMKIVKDLSLQSANLINKSLFQWSELVFQGTEAQVSTGRAPVPSKPSNADLAANEVTNGNTIPANATPTDVYGNNSGWTQYVPPGVDWKTLRGDSNGDGVPDWAAYVPQGVDWKTLDTSDTDYSNPDALTSNEKSITGRVVFDGQNYDDDNPTVTATYNMPFAPDDYFYYDANRIRRLARSGATAAAIKFGQTEAALDIGHAYGQNIVTNFDLTPTLDLSPVYIRLAGIEGAFLLDAPSYAWGPEGMVVSSDLMLVGVTGYEGASAPPTSWLRLPVAPSAIGPAGGTTIEASPVKANSIAIPGGFNVRNLAPVFAALPTNGADVFREWRSGVQVVPPTLVLDAEPIATGSAIMAVDFVYGLTLETDTAVLASGPVMDFAWLTMVTPPVAGVGVGGLAPRVATGVRVLVPAASVAVAGVVPNAASGASAAVPAGGAGVAGLAPELVGRMKTQVFVPAATVGITGMAPTVRRDTAVVIQATTMAVAAVAPAVSIGSKDPNFSNVSLLLHMNGSNGSTTFTDSSSNARVITAFGNAQISTAQSRFGGSSLILDGSGDYISATISAIGTTAYTIEGYFYAPVTNVTWNTLMSLNDGLQVYFHQGAIVGYGGGLPGSDLRSKQGQFGSLPSLASNTWHHWAITRTLDGTVNVFADGIAGGSPVTGNTYNSTGTSIRIGISTFSEYFTGHIDEVRVTIGVARYTGNFTPPSAPFPDA